MSGRVPTVIASSNLKFDLSPAAFEAGLRKVLAADPDIVALQEALDHRDPILNRVGLDLGYSWSRAKGGEPVLWRSNRYAERWVKPVRLARAEYVGHIPGRKDRLPASIATEVGLDDLWRRHPAGAVTVVEDYHLTAEVQDVKGGGGYKRDPLHLLRVLRHHREKRRLGRRMRTQQRRPGHEVYGAGDGNFSAMAIGGFVNCWEDHNGPPHGTLGGRPVDICFAAEKPHDLDTIATPSDHDTLVVTYP